MQKIELTVLFQDPFWVAVYERVSDGKLEVCRVVFGPEPKDYEVYDYFLTHWHHLRFSPPLKAEQRTEHRTNPKRMQRLIKKQMETAGMGTKSQEALKAQQAEGKAARQKHSREQKEAERRQQFDLKQQKRRKKHRGH